MAGRNNIFKSNYIELVKKAIPAFYIGDTSGQEEDLAYTILGKTVLAVQEHPVFFSVSSHTSSQIIPYFIPSEKLTRVTPQNFQDNVLKRFNKTFEDFKTPQEFKNYLSGTILPSIKLNSPSVAFTSSVVNDQTSLIYNSNGVHNSLVSSLGAAYFLNTGGYTGTSSFYLSSILAEYLTSSLYFGRTFTENEAVKILFEHIFRNRENFEGLKRYLPHIFHRSTATIDELLSSFDVEWTIDANPSNYLPSSRRKNILGVHLLPGATGEQVSALYRYCRGVSAAGDSAHIANAYVVTKVFKDSLEAIQNNTLSDELLFGIHRAKQLGYKFGLNISTISDNSSIGDQAYYLTPANFSAITSALTHYIASSIRVPKTLSLYDGALLVTYPGYDLDSFKLDNEPDLGWNLAVEGTEEGFAMWSVSALRTIRDNLIASGIAVPKLGTGGWSNYRKTSWWGPFFSACAAQSFTPSSFPFHSYHKNGTKISRFDLFSLIRSMALASGLDLSNCEFEQDEYNVNFFPVARDNPESVALECDDYRAAVVLASYDIEAIYNNFQNIWFFIHDKTFNNTNVQYSDDWSGKSVGLWLASGAPKPCFFAKQMISSATAGNICSAIRETATQVSSWSTNCIAAVSGNRMRVLLVNGQVAYVGPDSDRFDSSAIYEKSYLDYISFSNFNSSSVLNGFASALGQGIDYMVNGSISPANRTKHKEWGYYSIYSYTLDRKANAEPFDSNNAYVDRVLTEDDMTDFIAAQAAYGPGAGVANFSAGNPTWLPSIIEAKTDVRVLIDSTTFNTNFKINFDTNFIPTRITKQFLLNKTNNIPELRPEFDVTNANSAYSRLRQDYPSLFDPTDQMARFNAIDLNNNPSYAFNGAGQVQELGEEELVASLNTLENRVEVTLIPNSMILLFLERD